MAPGAGALELPAASSTRKGVGRILSGLDDTTLAVFSAVGTNLIVLLLLIVISCSVWAGVDALDTSVGPVSCEARGRMCDSP
jgi:hypothetical protein